LLALLEQSYIQALACDTPNYAFKRTAGIDFDVS
jgi:hypothetical protein